MALFRLAKLLLLASRPKTLIAGLCPVILGVVLAVDAGFFYLPTAIITLVTAIGIQIGTNYANDYFDFKKGADTADRQGPTRVTQAGLIKPETMKKAFIAVFILSFCLGLLLVFRGGWPILLLGVLAIFFGIVYTGGPFPLAYNGLGDLFVILFFGPVAVGGTFYLQALHLPPSILILGLSSGLFSAALLMVNNIRDYQQDKLVDKRTLVVMLGPIAGKALYLLEIIVATAIPFLVMPLNKFWLFLPLVIVLDLQRMLPVLFLESGPVLNKVLARTSRVHLSFVMVLSVLIIKF